MVKNEESINRLRRRIYILERTFESLRTSPLYKLTIFFSKRIEKVISKLKIQKRNISKYILKLVGFFVLVMYNIINKYLSKNNQLNYLLCRFLDRRCQMLGYRMKYGKLLRISSKIKEDKQSVYLHEKKLDLHYDSSLKAKRIYKEIK